MEIERQTGLPGPEVSRLFKRYTQVAANGIHVGEVALIPYKRVVEYHRKSKGFVKHTDQQGGLSGILGLTLREHPEVIEKFKILVLHKGKDAYRGAKYRKTYYYSEFIRLLRDAGVSQDEWPFNLESGGKRPIMGLIGEILSGEFNDAVYATSNISGKAHLQVGVGEERLIEASQPFDVVEVDAYKIDGFFSAKIKVSEVQYVQRSLSRFWMIAAIESVTAAVLAWRPVFRTEVSAQDVVDLLADAVLGDWKPRSALTVPELAYTKGSGMPCYVLPKCKEAQWGCLFLDNALQHHADIVAHQVRTKVGFSINYGQLKRPERRTQVEAFFKQACMRFIHMLPSTTGSNPHNGRVEHAEENAVIYSMDVDEFEEVMDVYISGYNATPKSGKNFSLSPLEALSQYLDHPDYIFPKLQQGIITQADLGSRVCTCTVRGSISKGIRPYVQVDKARYSSSLLSNRADLIGEKMLAIIDPQDYRKIDLYLKSGELVDTVHVLGKWSHTKHSVLTRKLVNRAIDKRVFACAQGDDAVLAYRHHLESKKNKSSDLELQRLDREAPPVVEPQPNKTEKPSPPKLNVPLPEDFLVVGGLISTSRRDK
ncbi:MAG: hypothetical protein LBJ33_24325 [Pseudomonas putida]|jgi:hypothetical protein|nr:hypothetical protein [Pseudomonas putida]